MQRWIRRFAVCVVLVVTACAAGPASANSWTADDVTLEDVYAEYDGGLSIAGYTANDPKNQIDMYAIGAVTKTTGTGSNSTDSYFEAI